MNNINLEMAEVQVQEKGAKRRQGTFQETEYQS